MALRQFTGLIFFLAVCSAYSQTPGPVQGDPLRSRKLSQGARHLENLISPAISGQTPKTSWDLRKESRRSFAAASEKIMSSAAVPLQRALALTRSKRYVAAEAACREALEILGPFPPFRWIGEDALAHVYLEEGDYSRAIGIWAPEEKKHGGNASYSPGLMIAYAKTGRIEAGLAVLRDFMSVVAGAPQIMDSDRLPTDQSQTADSLAATGFYLRAYFADSTNADKLSDLTRALQLAPRNGNINWLMASLRFYEFNQGEKVAPYAWAAYRNGGPVVKPLARQLLLQCHEHVPGHG